MKTIAFCNSTLAWGGGENWHLEAAAYLARHGYDVILMAHELGALYEKARSRAEARLRLEPLSIGRLSFINPLRVGRYARFLKANKVDAVVMNLPQDLKCMGLAAQRAGTAQIIYRRGSALPVKNSWLNRYLYGTVLTGLIVNSEATKSEVYRHNARIIPEERVVVLPNGIDIREFERRLSAADPLAGFNPSSDRAGSVLGTPNLPVVLGNAGRLNRQKGQHYLIYLAGALDALGVEYRLVIAGAGERREELERLAIEQGVDSKVVFTGFLEDTSSFWNSIDVFVLSSLWEGFGYVLLEAMLSAKPIVAFGVSNIPELVQDGVTGFLFPLPEQAEAGKTRRQRESGKADCTEMPQCLNNKSGRTGTCGHAANKPSDIPDMRPMAEAVRQLAQNPELRQRMGKLGKAFANPAFDQVTVMERFMRYIG